MAHFLLVHGACHGAWCWDEVLPLVRGAGHTASAPELPCDDVSAGLNEYADAALALVPEDVENLVVVGHSLGALVVPLIASRVPTKRIVFIAGIIGAPGQSLESLAATDSDRDLPMQDDDLETDDAGRFRFTDSGARRLLYYDCDPGITDAAISRLRFQRSMWTQVADFAAWPDTQIVSITCLDDRVVNPAWSDEVARSRLGVEPVHLYGGHSPFLGRPGELTDILVAGVRPG